MRRLFGFLFVASLALAACGGSESLNSSAGEDFTVSVGEAPEFDGCGSTGDIANYQWTIESAPAGTDADGKVLREEMGDCSFTLENTMLIDDVGEWTIELAVSDDEGESTDQVVVTVVE